MKAKLTLACLLFSTMLMAQVGNQPIVINNSDDMDIVPKTLSYDGSNRVYAIASEDKIDIYDNQFGYVKSITYVPAQIQTLTINQERDVTTTAERTEAWRDSNPYGIYVYDEEIGNGDYVYNFSTWTTQDIVNKLSSEWGTTVFTSTLEGETIFYQSGVSFYNEETFGQKYPIYYYVLANNQLFHEEAYYQMHFEYSEWRETSRSSDVELERPYHTYMDCDVVDQSIGHYSGGFLLTQTLFNEDEKYEYLTLNYGGNWREQYSNAPEPSPEYPILTKTTYQAKDSVTGFSIYSEDGTALATITFPSGIRIYGEVRFIKLDNNYYMLFSGDDYDLAYKINRSNSGTNVEQVSAPMRIAAYPSPANRNQTITIQLSGDNKTATELQVVNMNGQVTDRRTIPAGQQQTTLPASRFSTGVNLINTLQNGQSTGTTRVIVK